MHGYRRSAVASASALLLLLCASDAADIVPRWAMGPRQAVQAASIPGSAAQAISIRAMKDGTVALGWAGQSHDAVVVQKLSRNGAPLFGDSGKTLRSGRPCFPAGDARIHTGGPIDLLPAAGGGLWTAWTEGAGARELRVQRLDARGAQVLGIGGHTLFSGVPSRFGGGHVPSADGAILGDGRNGLHAVAVTTDGEPAGLRYRHLPANSTDGEPDRDLLLDGSGGEPRYPLLVALPDRTVAALWWNAGAWRFQVIRDGSALLAEGGVVVAEGTAAAWASARGTGRSGRPMVLLSLRLASLESRLLLLGDDGTVLRDEVSFPDDAGLSEAPEISTVGGIVEGFPEGIDLHGLLPGDPRGCLRSVRLPGGAWDGPERVDPPLSVGGGQTGSVGGPLWFWDLSNGTFGRLVGYRPTVVDRDLVPRLGPWMALCPGADDGSRLSLQGKWLYLAWVDPGQGTVLATRALVGRYGREIPLGPRMVEATLKGGLLHAELEGVGGSLPKSAGDLRLLVGGEEGVADQLDLVSVLKGPFGTWKATLADLDGNATATVEKSAHGRRLVIDARGVGVSNQSRALYLRLVTRGTARTGTFVLRPLAGGGGEFVAGEE